MTDESRQVVYADQDELVIGLRKEMKDRSTSSRTRGVKIADIRHINIEAKMQELVQKGHVEFFGPTESGTQSPNRLGFQILRQEPSPRNIFCNFNGSGIQAGTISEIQQALLDIQVFFRKKLGEKALTNWSSDSKRIHIGRVYKHYKGMSYKVLGIARHSETLEELVTYQALYGNLDCWVRPLKMFLESISVEGRMMPRFQLKDSV